MRSSFLLATAGIALLLCTAVSFGQYGQEPTDRIFVAYKLTAAQEAQFNVATSGASEFWGLLTGCSAIDYIYITPQNNGLNRTDGTGPVFTGEDDAQLTVYLAYGDSGLYFYFKVQDNNWVDYQVDCGGNPFGCTGDWANDAIDFALDPLAPEVHTLASFPLGNGWTKECAQYQLRFGGSEAPTFMRFNFWDNNYDGAVGVDPIKWQNFLFADAAGTYGILNKIVSTADDNIRIQEWLIPWRTVGNPEKTPVGACPAEGAMISAYFGYNDVDGDAVSQANLKELRTGTGDQMNAIRLDNGIQDSWSTILFGPSLTTQNESAQCGMAGVRLPGTAQHQVVDGKIVRTEYYGLNGQRLTVRNGKLMTSPHSVVIERKIFANGVVTPKMIVTK
jgi:hypothetical protein